jgi:hypothetical protein
LALAAVGLMFGMLLLCSNTAQAQDEKPVSFGFTAGLNLADVAFDPDVKESGVDRKMRTAFRFGGEVDFAVSPMISVSSGLIYSMKGLKSTFSDEEDGVPVSVDATLKLDYLTIPALLKVSVGEPGAPRPFFQIGPELGILLSAKVKGEGSGGGVSVSAETDVKKYYKGTEFGLLAGGGVEIPLGAMKGVAEVGYELGLSDIGKDESSDSSDESKQTAKTRNIFFAVGLKF